MNKTMVIGTLVLSGGLFASLALWPQTSVDYQPTVLSDGDILAEKNRVCGAPRYDWDQRNCKGPSEPIIWKVMAISNACDQKTVHLVQGDQDKIGQALQTVERWRCRVQFSAINGDDLKNWSSSSRPDTTARAWAALANHWQYEGVSRPVDFGLATIKLVRFSLGK